ncbi:phosphoenolpyruvate--protein phosphotransferase [Melioribacter roseus P3M-2]|uniref:Phosphoenolpyruvate-protein phosphotransferase n=1 Tax=Melioribacter roseus (strain DSM 23840 / JCM 17771 / VKM B-2668 / P3M-2) TaxID=1191523 RepID=I6ZUV6_MELRP|nr:phosphoenolpyruvate--protein phosphotransferase [Melioribacter roseus]AFN75809.1 phosphoenolpyruvate--protein phosphotransferase [Melioribacter roseus P3M-2]
MEKNQIILKGIAAAPGISIAPAYLFSKESESVSAEKIENVDEALENLDAALELSKKEMRKIFNLAVDKIGEKRAAIFEAQMMILDDPVLTSNIKERIKNEKMSPEYIVEDEISKYIRIMSASNEPYMKERSHDIEDIKNRIIRNLKKKKWKSKISNDVIVVTTSLSPSDTVLLSRSNVKGYVTDFGGLTSHAAIVARSLNIPAVVGIHEATNIIRNGDLLIIDGFHGKVIVNPTDILIKEYEEKIEKLSQYDEELLKLKSLPAVTLDGKEIKLMANLDISEEMSFIIHNCADGIGLVRTEQLFEEYEVFPDEDQQFEVYNKIAESIYPKVVIIRAFDIGGDKVLPVDLHEPNPMLGWRGIRLLLDSPNLFKTQIRAVLRASLHKNVWFMLPMINSLSEVVAANQLIDECKKELTEEGIKYDDEIPVGIMIEVPSAAVLTSDFADVVDFISIGTNDLIQYLLAVDRGNEIVSSQYQEFHPAVIRTIKHIIDEAGKKSVPIGMCGEMAADPFALPLLVGLGLESLSISAAGIPLHKKILRSLNYSELKRLADECLNLKNEDEINNKLHKFFNEKISDQIKNLY